MKKLLFVLIVCSHVGIEAGPKINALCMSAGLSFVLGSFYWTRQNLAYNALKGNFKKNIEWYSKAQEGPADTQDGEKTDKIYNYEKIKESIKDKTTPRSYVGPIILLGSGWGLCILGLKNQLKK